MSDAAQILEQARELYRQGIANHRDCLLKVGELLHKFVLEKLRESEQSTYNVRIRLKQTREAFIHQAADSLQTDIQDIGRLIGASMVAELLAPPEGLGAIPWATIHRFCRFVCRHRMSKGEWVSFRVGIPVIPSQQETWMIKEGFEESAKELFARAVSEVWAKPRAEAEVVRLFRDDGVPVHRGSRKDRKRTASSPVRRTTGQQFNSARAASPGDVADMCMELIEAAAEPAAVIARLRGLLDRYKPKLSMAV
jgi:hypothetical protein